MRPWTIDADDIRIADDFDEQLLHRTPWIEDFLDPSDDKFIVVATKGFGKTLLLKAKRIAYQDANRLCIPQNSLLDKPVGDKVFRRDMLTLYGESTQAWAKLWLTSISLAVLKRLELTDDLNVSKRLAALLADRNLQSVLDHFVNLLDFSRSDLFRCAREVDNQLIPRLRGLRQSVAVFIDSVDEYFNKHIQLEPGRGADAGEISPEIWFLSQMALVEVAYELRRISHHLKVFASVRKEAFARFADQTAMVQQYRGSAVDISYSPGSLQEIFRKNIEREKQKNLVAKNRIASDPVDAFLGRTEVRDAFTGQTETVLDYILRHSLLRPRDLMTIGQKLSAIAPLERADRDRFKAAVQAAAAEIAQEYLREIEPYVDDVDLARMLSLIPGNILTEEELENLMERYGSDGSGRRACETLYNAGLLGLVEIDASSGERVQKFLSPGDVSPTHDGALPVASHYLVRPVLHGIIGRQRPDFAAGIDRTNLVGHERPWVEPDVSDYEVRDLCVLFGDIKDFGRLMADGVSDRGARDAMTRAAEENASRCLHLEVINGDAVWIVDPDPNVVLKIAHRVREELFEAPEHPELRMAADYGRVQLRNDLDDEVTLAGGEAVLRVARTEPRVPPSEIWATREFKEKLEERPSLYGATAVEPDREDAVVNVRKPDSDGRDILVELFRIGPRS